MNRRQISPAIAIVLSALLAAPALASEPPAKPADNSPKLAYGLMMKQGGKVLFSPCRDRSYALVEDVSNDGRVFKGLNMVGLNSGKRLYAELIGVVENGAREGGIAQHRSFQRGAFEVTAVEEAPAPVDVRFGRVGTIRQRRGRRSADHDECQEQAGDHHSHRYG